MATAITFTTEYLSSVWEVLKKLSEAGSHIWMHEIELARRLGLIQTEDHGPHKLLQLLWTRIETDHGLKISAGSRTESPFIIRRISGKERFQNGTKSAEAITKPTQIYWYRFGSNHRFGCDIQRTTVAFMRKVNFGEIAFTDDLRTLWNDNVAVDATISYKKFIRKCWPLVNDGNDSMGDFMESAGARRRQDSLALIEIHKELMDYAYSSSVLTRGNYTFDGTIYTINNTADTANQTNQTPATPATFQIPPRRNLQTTAEIIRWNPVISTFDSRINTSIIERVNKLDEMAAYYHKYKRPLNPLGNPSNSPSSIASSSSSSSSSPSSNISSYSDEQCIKNIQQDLLNLEDEAIRRGICLCSEGLIQRTQGINRGQYHCSARSCDRKRLWNYNANHSELPPLPPIQTNITQMCNRQKLRILNDSKRSKQIKEKKQYDKIRRMNSDDADEYLSKYKDHNGNWMSWVYLCAKIAKNNKTDYTPDGHPMYLYLDQEHSLISNRKLKQGIATLSFISWTFTNSRSKYTNMNSLLCNAMLHINTIKRYERLLEVVPGELYVPSLTLHYEKLIGSLFVAAGGGSAFNKNRELDLIQIRKNYTEDLTDTAATTYAHNQKLVLIGHCIEDYLYDRETIKELPKIERVTPETVEECVIIAKDVIDFFRLAKAEIAAKPKNKWSPQFVDETLEPVWEMLTKHTGFTHTCLQTFFLQMGGMDAVTTKGNIAQVGKNGKVLGSFTDREKGTFPDVYQDLSEMCTHYQLWCLTNMMSGVRTVLCMNPQTSTSEQAVLTSMLMKIDNETFMQMGSMARVEIQCGDRLANNPHSTKRGSLEVMSNEETDNSMKIHDSVQAAMAHYESGASFPDPTDLNNATWFDKATKAAATPPPPNSSSSSSSSSSTQPPLPPTDFRASNLTFNEDVDAAIDRGDIRLQGLFPKLPFMQKVDNLIDTMFDDEISTSEKLISLGLKLKNTNYAKTKNNSIENTNSDNGNIESDMDDDDDVTMVDTDISVPIPADYGESDNEENKGEGEGDDLNPLLTYDANGDKVDPSNPLEEDDDTLMEEEEEIEKEKEEDEDKEEEEEEEETANPKKHNGDPITAIHVDKLNKTNLKKSLSHFSLSKFNAKRYSDEFRRKKLKNIISKQYEIKLGGDKADARKQIYHFLTKNSPNPTDADVSIRFADRVAFLACGPHLGKCGHALMIRGETKNFPVLMYMHDNDFDGLVRRLKKEVAEYPAKEQERLEKKLWQEHKDSQDPVNKGRGGKKRKRTKTLAVEAAEKSADDKFLTKRRKVLKNLLDTKIKKEENQRKKRHLQLKHLTFSHIGRDIIDRAFKIKAAMTKLYTDPCPKLVAADALNQSYLKMDVMRVTRFAACHGFFLALAKGIWDGKPIPYKAMGITPPTPSERYSFLGMSKYASLINTIFVECLMSYRLASFETLEAAESAAGELLVWHLQFDPDLSRDACFGTCFTRYQLEGLFGMLRSFRRLLTMARTARRSWETHNQCTAPYFLFGIKFGRLCNSYIEGRFSIFRCSVGNASMDGVSITGQFKSMMAREMRGMVRLGIERKQYGGLRAATEQMNRDEDMKTE